MTSSQKRAAPGPIQSRPATFISFACSRAWCTGPIAIESATAATSTAGSPSGWADGRPDSIDVRPMHPYEQVEAGLKANPDRFGRSYLCSGVTSVFDVGGYPWTLRLHDRFEGDTRVPHVVAAGPLLSTLDHWLNLAAERQFIVLKDEESARNGVRYLESQGSKAVKVWF